MSLQAAEAHHRDVALLGRQATAVVMRDWSQVDPADIGGSWSAAQPTVAAAVVGAQTVAAEMADPYLRVMLDDEDTAVDVGGMVSLDPGGLYAPALRAKALIGQGVPARRALGEAGRWLALLVAGSVADTAGLSVAAGMGARPHGSGYYRMLTPPSCSRCAILAGRHYRYNAGFQRHPHCDCVHIPTREADDSYLFDARGAIEAGKVTGLSAAERRAIVEFGADPSQVVNARKGMYLASGGLRATYTGTSRRAVAGARMLARDIDRALGVDVTTRTYANWTFDRLAALKHAELFRRGKTYTRTTSTGRVQQYAYRFLRTLRPTPETILAEAGSRAAAIRLLTNYGYIL